MIINYYRNIKEITIKNLDFILLKNWFKLIAFLQNIEIKIKNDNQNNFIITLKIFMLYYYI